MKPLNKTILTVAFCLSFIFLTRELVADEKRCFYIDISKDSGKINGKIFGTCILGWEVEHGKKIKDNYKIAADYGYGIWDPKNQKFCKKPLGLIKNIKIRSLRFIGQFTGWEKGVNEYGLREYSFGLREQNELCKLIGAEPIICLQNLNSEDSNKALIKYLKDGYPEVTNVEIGNESYYIVDVEDYAEKYLYYYKEFKSINPKLRLGIVGRDAQWNRRLLGIVGSKYDFLVMHCYPYGGREKDVENRNAKEIFKEVFVKTLEVEDNIKQTKRIMFETTGEVKPIAVTEFNAWFVQGKLVPYRHCLGAALVNAELLRIFMEPKNNIMCANYWNFINEYWGMIANGFSGNYRDLRRYYYQRPSYFVFEMYAKHFGEYLLDIEEVNNGAGFKEQDDLLDNTNWQVRDVRGVNVDLKQSGDNEIRISFLKEVGDINYYHAYKTVRAKPNTFYRLTGSVKVDGLEGENGICLELQDARGYTKTRFAQATERLSGSAGWVTLEKEFITLPDTEIIDVIIRRVSGGGNVTGNVSVKDVKLFEIFQKNGMVSINTSTNEARDKIYIMVVNRNINGWETVTFDLGSFEPNKDVKVCVLNGPLIDSTNERRPHNDVKIIGKGQKINGKRFNFTFEPHSLTAIEIERKSN